MISQLQLKGGQGWEGTLERGSSISSMDRANPKPEGWGAGRAEKPSSSYAPDPLPPPEQLFPVHGARCWCFYPRQSCQRPSFHLPPNSINQAAKLLEASQTVLGTNPSFNIY